MILIGRRSRCNGPEGRPAGPENPPGRRVPFQYIRQPPLRTTQPDEPTNATDARVLVYFSRPKGKSGLKSQVDSPRKQVIIYTDGGCDPNPGTGGWAAVLRCGVRIKELSGGDSETTNNRMEMTAAIRALESLKYPCKVDLHTDSQYLQRGITEWLPNWKRMGFRRKGGAVLNADLWRRLDELAARHDVRWIWVRGHAGDPINERCDELAARAILEQKRMENGFGVRAARTVPGG